MAKSRKTTEVKKLVEMANNMILNSTDDSIGYRQGIMLFIENILHETGNYNGFGYLSLNDLQKAHSEYKIPGINDPNDEYEERFKNTDRTRVHYYIS